MLILVKIKDWTGKNLNIIISYFIYIKKTQLMRQFTEESILMQRNKYKMFRSTRRPSNKAQWAPFHLAIEMVTFV